MLLWNSESIQFNEDETVEYLVTGSVDDTVKVWEQKDKSLQLKHKLTGHSLGVVSVAVSSDGSSKYINNKKKKKKKKNKANVNKLKK